jgi:hypothetical protein
MLFIVGSLIFAVLVIVGANVWVLWDVLFPGRAESSDSISLEIAELLEAENRKA